MYRGVIEINSLLSVYLISTVLSCKAPSPNALYKHIPGNDNDNYHSVNAKKCIYFFIKTKNSK